jgi:pimeloyl-ACP methyl ester carboxylesterase
MLHGSAGSGSMWRAKRDAFSPLYQVISPDLIGYGRSAPWQEATAFSLEEEVRRVDALIPCCEERFDVVGYSYGGAVALALALGNPVRVRSLTLIEPVFFAALKYAGENGALAALMTVYARFTRALERGEREAAMRDFIDFWSGSGAWDRMAEPVRDAMRTMADKIRLDWQASFDFDPGPGALAAVEGRTLLVRGDRSPEPMRRLVDALHALMPGSAHVIVRGANHLLPFTHANEMERLLNSHLHAASERNLR